MINRDNPLACPTCGHSHTEYPPRGRCAGCGADLRATIAAHARAMAAVPGHPLAQVMQARGCHVLIVVVLLSSAITLAVAFLPISAAVKSLSAACVACAVAFGAVRYGWAALEATAAGRRGIGLFGDTFVQMLLYLGAGLLGLAGVVLAWIGLADLLG